MLEIANYSDVSSATDPRRALELFQQARFDLVLTDLHMPHLDGFALMELMRAGLSSQTYLPIIVLTADINTETRRRALAAGANEFLLKPFDQMEVILRIENLLQTRSLHVQLRE